MTEIAGEFEYFKHENSHYRWRTPHGGVDDILQDGEWVPYTGNRTDPYLYGNQIENPFVGSSFDLIDEPEDPGSPDPHRT